MSTMQHAEMPAAPARPAENGALLVTLLVVLVPLLMLVAGATTVMTSRNSKLLRSLQEAKALLAAEAAIEEASHRANTGTLAAGALVQRDLGAGMTNSYRAVWLATNGVDDDGDGLVDEVDERTFQVVATGRHGLALRRVSALLVEPAPLPPWRAAILALGTPDISAKGGSLVSGFDTKINGSRAPAVNDVAGIATEPPHDTAGLASRYTQSGGAKVQGKATFDTMASIYDLPGLMASAHNSVRNQLTPGTFNGNLGNALANDWEVSYSPGNLKLAGNLKGAGILVVAGDLELSGSLRYDGLVIVLGSLKMSGTVLVNGAMIQGPAGASISTVGNSTVRFSTEALSHILSLLRPAYQITGWREIGR
jgi:hypothetical protein